MSINGTYTNLDDLYTGIRCGEAELTADLPTFGGETPEDTQEIWSWDETRLMVGTDTNNIDIVLRSEWYGE